MPSKLGELIADDNGSIGAADGSTSGGKPTVKSATVGSGKPADGSNESEIIAGFESFDPNDTIRINAGSDDFGADNGSGKRKRGRPKGSGRAANGAAKETQVPASLVDLSGILQSVHTAAAALLKVEELMLSQAEADAYANAIKDVAAHYPVAFDPKKVAIANAIITIGGIYSVHFMAYRNRVKMEAAKKAAPGPQLVNRAGQQPTRPNGAARPEAVPSAPSDLFGTMPPIESWEN